MYPGATFLVPSGPIGFHLFVAVTKACPNNSFLLLSVSSIKDGKTHDTTCVFSGGEHEFITRPSFVDYAKPIQRFLTGIQKCISAGVFVQKADLDGVHFNRVCAGIPLSPRRQRWAIEHFNNHR